MRNVNTAFRRHKQLHTAPTAIRTNNDFLSKDPREAEGRPNTIVMHPDFRMVVLANRPGFPFLGNDFFGALGRYIHTTHTHC